MEESLQVERLSVGQQFEKWKQEDGFLIEYGGRGGFILYVFLKSPSPEEKAVITESAEKPEIGFSIHERVGLFSFRFGEIYGECPYYPGLYKGKKAFMDTGTLLHFLILLIDGEAGELQGIRLVGTDRAFSRKVALWCNDACEGLPLSKKAYDRIVDALQAEEIEKHHREAAVKWNYKDMKDEEKAAREAAQEKGD